MKKWLLFLAIAIGAALFLFFQMNTGRQPNTVGQNQPKGIHRTLKMVKREPTSREPLKQFGGRTPRETADNYVEAHREEWKLQAHHELRGEVSRSPLGSSVHYDIYQDGLPVVGVGIDIRMNRELQVVEVENGYRPLEKADTHVAQLPVEEIVKVAGDRYAYRADGPVQTESRILFASEAMTSPQLAVVVPLVKETDKGVQSYQVVFRATDGQFLGRTISRSEF